MAAADRDELERLRRHLNKVTAERDRLLAENRRLLRDFKSLKESGSVNSDFTSAASAPLVACVPIECRGESST